MSAVYFVLLFPVKFPLTYDRVFNRPLCLTFPIGQMRPSVLFSWYLKFSCIQSATSVLFVGLLCAFLDLELGGRRAADDLVCLWESGFLVLDTAVHHEHVLIWPLGESTCKTRPLPGSKSPVQLSSGNFGPRLLPFHEAEISPQQYPPTDSAFIREGGKENFTFYVKSGSGNKSYQKKRIRVENYCVRHISCILCWTELSLKCLASHMCSLPHNPHRVPAGTGASCGRKQCFGVTLQM